MAKEDVSAIVSGMGIALSILKALDDKRYKRGITEDVMHQLTTPSGDALLDKFVDLMAAEDANQGSSFAVAVDYDRKLERMVEDGKYDWKNSEINSKNFPTCGKSNINLNVKLVHFNRVMASDEILHELDQRGTRPATLPELLAFGATYPHKQREFPIVALGSLWRNWNGYRYSVLLDRDGSERTLAVNWLESVWSPNHRFAAIRNSA